MRLENKVAIVTGSAQGMGYTIARALAENGAKIVLCPMENLNEMQDIPTSILSNTDVNFFSSSQMLLHKAILSE